MAEAGEGVTDLDPVHEVDELVHDQRPQLAQAQGVHAIAIKKWQKWTENLEDQEEEVKALESFYGETKDFEVTSTPSEEHGLFSVQINILVALPESSMNVEAWMPYESEAGTLQVAARVRSQKPDFKRSVSGQHLYSKFQVNHLKPLVLHVTMPPTYPSDGPPIFNLSCLWLHVGQLTALCKQLDAMWREMGGMPIVYFWVDWLQTNTFSHFSIEDTVWLTPHSEETGSMVGPQDPRALSECSNIFDGIEDLLQYDCQKEWEKFVSTVHECGVCFMEYPGRNFYILQECNHHVCRECMTEYCNIHVTDGTVQQLICPDLECKVSVPPPIVRDVLGDEAFIRWERLLLQKGLETMDDVVWCPRCNQPVISDPDSTLNLSFCTNCTYSFCTRCRESWHQRTPCASLMDKVEQLEAKVVSEGTGSDGEGGWVDPDVEARRRKLARMKLELMTKMCIRNTTKPCPRCRCPIEKSGGCNKMHCTKCHTVFCWSCERKIEGYSHFEDTACEMVNIEPDIGLPPRRLYRRPIPEGARQVREAILQGEADTIRCPSCGQPCLRAGNNNHIRCWSCKTHMCYQCKGKISDRVTDHFRVGMPCVQHSQ